MAETHERLPERRDVSGRAMMLFLVAFVAFLAITLIVMRLLFDTSGIWPVGGPAETGNTRSPALQRQPVEDLAELRRREERELHILGWVDRDAGIARIPIGEAMKMIAAGGLPEWHADAKASGNGECALLTTAVPRTPQAQRCRSTPNTPAPEQGKAQP
jgi:hypothetical protein